VRRPRCGAQSDTKSYTKPTRWRLPSDRIANRDTTYSRELAGCWKVVEGSAGTHNPLVVCSNHTGPSCFCWLERLLLREVLPSRGVPHLSRYNHG